MATRFDAATDRLARTTGILNFNAAYTWMGWVYISTDQNAYTHIWSINTNNQFSQNADYIGMTSDGTTLISYVDNGGAGTEQPGTNLTAATWYHIAVVRASTTSLLIYLNGVQDSNNTRSVATRGAASRMEIGALSTSNADPFNGRVQHVKIWDTNLSVAEIQQEMVTARPQRTANLWLWTPLHSSGDILDYSGNARDWTAGGALTTEDGPPVGYGAPILYAPYVAAAGGTIELTVSIAGTSTTPDTAALSVARALTVSLSGTSTTPDTALLTNTIALTVDVAGTSTTPDTAVLSVARSIVADVAGTSTTPDTAALSVARSVAVSIDGTSTTPDTAVLSLSQLLTVDVAGTSTTPDTALLAVARSAPVSISGTSTTPDTAVLSVARSLTVSIAGTSSTWDAIVLGLGRTSLEFYGNADAQIDRVRIPLTTSGGTVATPVNVGAADFTYECWIKCAYADNATTATDVRVSNIVLDRDIWNDTRGYVPLGVTRRSGVLVAIFGANNGSGAWPAIRGTTQIGDDAWHHIAVVRNGSTISIFVDGVSDASGTFSTSSWAYPTSYTPTGGQDNEYLVIGCEKHDFDPGVNGYTGRLDSLRVSNTARYTGSFTPATGDFAPDTATVGLYAHNDATGTTLRDSAQQSASPVNGELLVGGSPSGPTWASDDAFGAVIELAVAIAGDSTTPDTATLGIARVVEVSVAGTSATPDTAVLSVARVLVVALSGDSATPDTVVLTFDILIAVAVDGTSTTPDAALVAVLRSLLLAVAGTSTTPDTAAIGVERDLILTIAGTSTTPDTAVLVLGMPSGVVTLSIGTPVRPSVTVGDPRRPTITVEE